MTADSSTSTRQRRSRLLSPTLAVLLVALLLTQGSPTSTTAFLPSVSATPLRLSVSDSVITDRGRRGLEDDGQGRIEFIRREVIDDQAEGGSPQEEQEIDVKPVHLATTILQMGSSGLDIRAVNQSTGILGADYVKLRQEFNGGYIMLSVAMAFVGSMCTLELLLRRTSNRGLHNVLLLLAAGVCFGSVVTFSMHFIGNSSLTLHHPQEREKNKHPFSLTYDAGWTVLSLVVSCAVTILAFFVMGLEGEYIGDFFRKLGILRPRRDDEQVTDDDSDSEDKTRHPAVITDLSMKEKRTSVKSKIWQRKISNKARESAQLTSITGDKKTGTYDGQAGRRRSRQEEVIPVIIKPSPSDPVASGYDNIPVDPASVGTLHAEPYDPALRRASIASATAEILPVLDSDYSSSHAESSINPSFSFPSSFSEADSPSTSVTSDKVSPIGSRDVVAEKAFATGRRSSVPNLVVPGTMVRDFGKQQSNLTRIQSLPETDVDESHAKGTFPARSEEAIYAGRQDHIPGDLTGVRRRSVGQQSSPDVLSEKENVNMTVPATVDETYEDRQARHARRRRRRSERNRTSKLKRWLGLDVVTVEDVLKIIFSGAIAGVGIAGMHYIGQVSINNIGLVRYSTATIVGSVLIACAAVFTGLYIMFIILRPKLKHGWLTKIGVALVLAGAVCAMHYTAMSGQEYALYKGERPSGGFGFNTRRLIIGLVSALAFVACTSIFSFTLVARLRMAAHRKGRRRVVVAAMIYDNENRLLVTPDGLLPMCDIQSVEVAHRRSTLGRSASTTTWDSGSDVSSVLDVDLTLSHPAFVAALRSTWAWRQPGVSPAGAGNALLRNAPKTSGMEEDQVRASDDYSHTGSHSRRLSVLSTAESAVYPAGGNIMPPLAINVGRFLDRFQAAVAYLASDVIGHEQSVRRLGVLYDRILTTGHVKLSVGERSRGTLNNGQLIFLVRRVTTAHEKSQLLSRNHLFAESSAVANVMSNVLAVPVEEFTDIMDDQQVFCDYGMASGVKIGRVYVAASIIQPTTFDGIQVCVEKHRRHQLPMRELTKVSPVPSALRTQASHSTDRSDHGVSGSIEEIGEALSGLEGQTLFDMMATKNMLFEEESLLPEDPSTGRLRMAIVDAMIPMLDRMCTSKEMAKLLPRLQVTPYLVPITPPLPVAFKTGVNQTPEIQSAAQMAWIIYFQAVLSADGDFEDLDWEPWALFKAQSECVARDGREGLQAARNAILQSTGNPAIAAPRRPSKVQFSPFGAATMSHQPSSMTDAPSILVNPENRDALQQFESFTFPASAGLDSSNPASRGPRQSSDLDPGLPRYKRTSIANLDASATSSRDSGPLGSKEQFNASDTGGRSGRGPVNGVGLYHQDWLSRLVREDMHHRSGPATAFV